MLLLERIIKMYFLDELAKEHQKELLHEAELEKTLTQATAQDPKIQTRLRNTVGDLLITGGRRLKGQYPIVHKPV